LFLTVLNYKENGLRKIDDMKAFLINKKIIKKWEFWTNVLFECPLEVSDRIMLLSVTSPKP